MPDIEKLRDLLARVEAAEGEDKAMDEAIWRTLMDKPERGFEAVVGRYSGSIDAAVALVERVYPLANIHLSFSLRPEGDPPKHDGAAKCARRAVASLLRLSIAQQEAAHG